MALPNKFLVCLYLATKVSSIKVPVYFLNADIDPRNPPDNNAPDRDCVHTLADPKPLPEQVTVCQRTMHYTYMSPKSYAAFGFSFGKLLPDWDGLEEGWLYGEWETGPWWGFRTKEKPLGTLGWVGLGDGTKSDHMVWRHTCLLLDFKNGRMAAFENGIKFFDKTGIKDIQDTYEGTSKQIDIVTAGCTYRSSTTSTSLSVHGKVTDFQMWDRNLSDKDLLEITGCRQFPEGNLVSWEGDAWYLNSSRGTARMEVQDLEEDVCASSSSSLHLVPYPLKMEPEAIRMCAKFSGKVAQYSNKTELDTITRFLSSRQNLNVSNCVEKVGNGNAWRLRVWTANTDSKVEGIWKDRYNDQDVDFTPWPADRPYAGGFRYNCMVLEVTLEDTGSPRTTITDAIIKDEDCGSEFCSLCSVAAPTRKMSIRGLCPQSIFDRTYTYTVTEEGQAFYLGYHFSVLFYDQTNSSWVWYDGKDNGSVAVSYAPESSLLLGLHDMDFSGVRNDKCHRLGQDTVKPITLTTCGPGFFTCHDGQCISMDQRCNQISNCFDKSDEKKCVMVFMEDNYNKQIAPFSYDEETMTNIPVNINVSMSITDILKIEEVDHTYTLKFRLLLEWNDFRLQYFNLKMSRSQNALSLSEMQKLWIPFLVFENTQKNEATVATGDTELTVLREGKFIGSKDDNVEEINIFEGTENRIIFEQVYTKTFKCTYQLQLYPFDTQVCTVVMKVRKLETAVMMITPHMIAMESETTLTQYIIKNWTLDYINSTNPDSGIQMVITLRRRILNSILTVYLPTVLVLTIVYATNYFKEFFFEAVVSVNLTSLLVLTTLFISVSGSLPQTAYIKMVDVWLIFAQAVPWVEVLLHTWIDMMRTEGEEGREINNHGKTIIVGGDDTVKMFGDVDDNDSVDDFLNDIVGGKAPLKKKGSKVQVNEEKMVEARKDFYNNADFDVKIVKRLQFVTIYVVPASILVFSLLYWGYGLAHYFK